ncbi:MAG: ATP-binding protein [Chlamydiota bacterium]
MSFRSKVFIGHLVLFVLFLLLLIPLINVMVGRIAINSLETSTRGLIKIVQDAQNESEMIDLLEKHKTFPVFRITLIDSRDCVLYDSYLESVVKGRMSSQPVYDHPEIEEALKTGEGVYRGYSKLFDRELLYVAVSFDFQGKMYVMRTAFATQLIDQFLSNFEVGFFFFCVIVLLFFAFMIWLIFYQFSRPIQKITNAIKSYEIGKEEELPPIVLPQGGKGKDDFSVLGSTINALTARIRSQLKNIIDERNEKEAILESLGEGVIAVDAAMQIRYVNFIGSKMLGSPKRYLLNNPFPTMNDPRFAPLLDKCRHLLKTCQESGEIITDALAIGDLHKRYIDLIAAPKTKGSGAIIVLQDKSSHYKVLEMGKDFVANASHELRTPITIIKGFAETLQDLPELSPEMLADITEKIVRNCERMDNLVKNLLTLADLEHLPETRFRDCDLVTLAENCKHMVECVYTDAEISIEKNCDEINIAADVDILELAVMNLMDNAAKYSVAPAIISVLLEQRGDEAIIKISDQGIGIPETDIDHIFERFYTVNKAHSRRLGGAGLGLSIVKTIIERHDGTIHVESAPGHGTTFTIHLPIHRP